MRKRLAGVVTLCVLLVGAGYFAAYSRYKKPDTKQPVTAPNTSYPLLAKRLFIDEPNDVIIRFSELRKDLNAYFEEHDLTKGSLYFEYLPTGTAIRINGDDREIAASLMKTPSAMDLYRLAELGKVNLDAPIALKSEWLDDEFGTLYKKGAGYQLSLREATKIMLEQSDNTALNAITDAITGKRSVDDSVLRAVDVDYQQNADLTVSINARSYSSFLTCLYFSCYVNHEHSQELLDYLSHTDFPDRIVAGIPNKSVQVAHKIGVANDSQSDCGIVYVPKRNYVLCVMLHLPATTDTDDRIAEISRKVYDFVTSK
jgi:beta-lactamase class A